MQNEIDPAVSAALTDLKTLIANGHLFADKYRAAFEARAVATPHFNDARMYLHFVCTTIRSLHGTPNVGQILDSLTRVDITDSYIPYTSIIEDNTDELLIYWVACSPVTWNFKGVEYIQRLKFIDRHAKTLTCEMPKDLDYLRGIRVRTERQGEMWRQQYPVKGKLRIGEWIKDVVFHEADFMVALDLDLKAISPVSLTLGSKAVVKLDLWIEILGISIMDPHSTNLRTRQATKTDYRQLGFYKACFGLIN